MRSLWFGLSQSDIFSRGDVVTTRRHKWVSNRVFASFALQAWYRRTWVFLFIRTRFSVKTVDIGMSVGIGSKSVAFNWIVPSIRRKRNLFATPCVVLGDRRSAYVDLCFRGAYLGQYDLCLGWRLRYLPCWVGTHVCSDVPSLVNG